MTSKKTEFKKTYELKNPRREETVTVEAVSENGLKANGKWYNFSKFKPEVKSAVAKGYTYKLTISTSTTKDGTQFDNVIAAEVISTPLVQTGRMSSNKPNVTEVSRVIGNSAGKSMFKERDFDAEARGKSRCALFAAALQSPMIPALTETQQEAIDFVKALADAGMEYTFPEEVKPSIAPLQDGTVNGDGEEEVSPLDNLQ